MDEAESYYAMGYAAGLLVCFLAVFVGVWVASVWKRK